MCCEWLLFICGPLASLMGTQEMCVHQLKTCYIIVQIFNIRAKLKLQDYYFYWIKHFTNNPSSHDRVSLRRALSDNLTKCCCFLFWLLPFEPFACHGIPQIKILWVSDKQPAIKLQLKSCDPVVLVTWHNSTCFHTSRVLLRHRNH